MTETSTSVRGAAGLVGVRGLTARWRPRSPGWDGSGAERLGVGPLVGRVLASRGLAAAAAAEAFLRPSMLGLHDPSLLPDCDRAAERLVAALRSGEQVVIYGDYDVDGVTATAILWHTLKTISPGSDVRTYVPHRLDEGYGLNSEAIAALASGGASVIVSVDCGITALAPAQASRELGVDLIITDHHNPPSDESEMPEAYAAVHPRAPGSAYPFGELCGAGVAYKLAWRVMTVAEGSSKISGRLRELLLHLLAFAALGSIADVVPLVGENRIIARYGLGRLKGSPIAGLRALIDASGLGGAEIDAERVAFTLAPRLNACGRLGHAREAVRMLTEASYEEAFSIADELNGQNAARRKIEEAIVEEAAAMAEAAGMTAPDRRAIVLSKPGWHPGVVGIACSRLVERYCRPVILLGEEDGLCGGSGRSVPGVNLHGALEGCGHLLERFGGHDMAAGLAVRRERLEEFQEALIAEVNGVLGEEELVRTLGYDCEATLEDLTVSGVGELASIGPCGAGNPAVRLRIGGLTIAERPRQVGKHGKHLQVRLRGECGRFLKCIAWRWGEHAGDLAAGMPVEILARPMLSSWGGATSVEAEMHDLCIRRLEH